MPTTLDGTVVGPTVTSSPMPSPSTLAVRAPNSASSGPSGARPSRTLKPIDPLSDSTV